MSTLIATARRGSSRISNFCSEAIRSTPWQLRQMQGASEQLEEVRFAEGERTMLEAERADLYELSGYVLPRTSSSSV